MKSRVKIIALLLALTMLLTSCDSLSGIIDGAKTTFGEIGTKIETFFDGLFGEPDDGRHTITFVTNGGKAIDPIKVEDGERAGNLPTPKKEGYKFLGWYIDEACTTVWKNSTKLSDDVTLYAKWKELYIFDRQANSTSPAELLSWYTATPEEFELAKALIDRMKEAGMNDINSFDAIYEEFETVFYHLAEQMTIANILYYCDMTDEEAKTRDLDTKEMFREVQNAYNIALQHLLENSSYKDELFEGWTEEEKRALHDYSPEIMVIRNQIDELQAEYNDIEGIEEYSKIWNTTDGKNIAEQIVPIYKEIIILNNQLARAMGYDNYYDYATKEIYGRDYTQEDLVEYHGFVKKHIAGKVDDLVNAWRTKYSKLSGTTLETYKSFMNKDFDSMEDNYVMMYFDSLGDTNMGVAMRDVFESENCVFADHPKSHPTAFQTWLYESEKPFCLFGSDGQSATTIVHEVGHYYAAYTNDDINDYDLCETHSQGNEFLFMDFCSDKLPKNVFSTAMIYQFVNTCGTITLASIVDQFEQKVYSLSDDEIKTMTVEDFDKIMTDITSASEYKGVLDSFIDPCAYWKLVAVDNPVYYVSYSVSAISSLGIYSMVLEDEEAAYAAYRALVETEGIEEMGYVEALEVAGVPSPFDESTHTKIAKLIDELIK